MAGDELEPFATLKDLQDRWPDFPPGADAHANVLLGDASQFIVDTVPSAMDVSEATRRRIVCAVVRRSMETPIPQGLSNMSESAGAVSMQFTASNPSGDFYLTKQEKVALGGRKQRAFGVQIAGFGTVQHRPWCNLNFGATYCSCGADIAGEPIYEAG